MVTIKQIAERAQVSTATVSNVIHGKIRKVSPETVERVRRLIEEMGYLPPDSARALHRSDSEIIAVVAHSHRTFENTLLSDPFYGIVIGTIEEELRRHGYYMMFYSAQDVESIFKMVTTWNIDGIIALSFSATNCLKLNRMTRKPVVSIDWYNYGEADERQITNIGLNDPLGGLLMTEHLLNQGYSSIYVCGNADYGVDAMRWQGALEAYKKRGDGSGVSLRLTRLGRNINDRLRYYTDFARQVPFRKRTALFFLSDGFAMEAIRALTEYSVRIPEDVAVAGFDGSPYAIAYSVPRLTTIRQDFQEKGRRAVEEMVDALKNPDYQPKNITLPVSLMVRNST